MDKILVPQKVIAARDFKLVIAVEGMAAQYFIVTGANFTANISGNTEDIHAFGTPEPIGTDNGSTIYDVSFTLQQAEAIKLKDAIAQASATNAVLYPDGAVTHIRQLIEKVTITANWNKKRDNPPSTTQEAYLNCTGVSEADSVERGGTETLKVWTFRARGMQRKTFPFAP